METYTEITEKDVLLDQLTFASMIWKDAKDKDERDANMNVRFRTERAAAMEQVDGLLDRLGALAAKEMVTDYGE